MIIQIDADFDVVTGRLLGYHTYDTQTPAVITIPEHANPGVKHTALEHLALLNVNPAAKLAHGYDVITKLPGFPPGTTRWQVLVAAITAAPVGSPERALGLVP